MPIGLVSDDLFKQELNRLTRKSDNKPPPERGRKEGETNVPDSLRKIIGETAVIEGRKTALELASKFDISPSSVSAYAHGATSTASYNSPSKDIIQHINKSRRRAIKRASAVMNDALGAISQDKLDYTDAKDLAGIAKDMSAIIKNLEPQNEVVDKPNSPQFVIFAPSFHKEETYEHITVNE